MKFPKFHRELVFLSAMTILLRRDLYAPKLNLGFDIDKVVLVASLIFTVLSSVQWCAQVVDEITTHLGIYCFSLQKRPYIYDDPRKRPDLPGKVHKKE